MRKKTIVYIDGFNLYYGCLKDSPYKWLDLRKLCHNLLGNEHNIHIKNYHNKMVGVIFPSMNLKRRPSSELIRYSHFVKRIRYGLLRVSELPFIVPNPPFESYMKPKEWN